MLVAATWAAGLASCATSAGSARSAGDASLGRTEAAGSVHFVRVNIVPGGATSTMEGSVNFARSELSMVAYSGAGRASLSGVGTTEYLVAMPAQDLSGTKLEPFTVDVWLDHEGRVRRSSSNEMETIKGRIGKLRFSTVTTLSDFGAPVHV